jgi:hypothetical protein
MVSASDAFVTTKEKWVSSIKYSFPNTRKYSVAVLLDVIEYDKLLEKIVQYSERIPRSTASWLANESEIFYLTYNSKVLYSSAAENLQLIQN